MEDWIEREWEVVTREGEREDFDLWRCAMCKWLYKEQVEYRKFSDLPDDWKCPVCGAGKKSFEKVGQENSGSENGTPWQLKDETRRCMGSIKRVKIVR